MTEPKPKKRSGFASMTVERRREVASKGGLSSSAKGVAHRFTKEEARAAGQKSQALKREKAE